MLATFLLIFFAWVWLSNPKTSTDAIGSCIIGAVLGLAAAALVRWAQ